MASWELTDEEGQIITQMRALQRHENFTLTIYGQGSHKRQVLDMVPAPRIRLSTTRSVSLAVDD